MSKISTTITEGIIAFVATNIDDIIILLLFFSQLNTQFRCRHIFLGQYLGFTAIIIASLPGFLGCFEWWFCFCESIVVKSIIFIYRFEKKEYLLLLSRRK